MQKNINMDVALYTKRFKIIIRKYAEIQQYMYSITIPRDTKIVIRKNTEKHQYAGSIIY